ncbi:MAG: AAA family ATPase [Acidobacteriota bacterium]
MLKSLSLSNFTVFPSAELTFGDHLNVLVGENGTGKTHILKAAYAGIAVSADYNASGTGWGQGGWGSGTWGGGKSIWTAALAQKLVGVFRPDELGRLVTRARGRRKSELSFHFNNEALDFSFSFSTLARSEVTLKHTPTEVIDKRPVYLPTRELLTIYPGFVSLYETSHLSFEATWRDTCVLLGAPLARGPREKRIKELLGPLETAMGGSVELDAGGRFYLKLETGRMEMHLVAEGLRKLATIARLIATGSLLDKGYLFWDEPESNLNPRIIKTVARVILQLAESGIQVFIATHSLFLLRELHILQSQQFAGLSARYFGLERTQSGVNVHQGNTVDDIGSIAALDEGLQQADRYIDTEMGLPAEASPEER